MHSRRPLVTALFKYFFFEDECHDDCAVAISADLDVLNAPSLLQIFLIDLHSPLIAEVVCGKVLHLTRRAAQQIIGGHAEKVCQDRNDRNIGKASAVFRT